MVDLSLYFFWVPHTPLPALGPGAVMLPNGPADMRSAVMITLRDFSSVCLNDGRPWGRINNQPAAVSPATVLIWNFLRRFWANASGSGPLFPPSFIPHHNQPSELTAASLDVPDFLFFFLSIKHLKNPAKCCIDERKQKHKTKQRRQTLDTIPALGRFLSHAAIFLF